MDIEKIVSIIKDGGIICIPTDTVYGIVCDATNIESVSKVYEMKRRPLSKPLIILVSDKEMMKRCVSNISDLENTLIDTYSPGPVTYVLNKSNYVPDIVTSGNCCVAIRIPGDKNLLEIIRKLDRPIVATSANVSNGDVVKCIDMLNSNIKSNLNYIYDGGIVDKDASTLIKVIDNKIVILREGKLSLDIKKKFNA